MRRGITVAAVLGTVAAFGPGCAATGDDARGVDTADTVVEDGPLGTSQQAVQSAACKTYDAWNFCTVQASYDAVSCLDLQKAMDTDCFKETVVNMLGTITQQLINFAIASAKDKALLSELGALVLTRINSGTTWWAGLKWGQGGFAKCRSSNEEMAQCALEAIINIVSDVVWDRVGMQLAASLLRDRAAALAVGITSGAPTMAFVVAPVVIAAGTVVGAFAGCKIANARGVADCEAKGRAAVAKCNDDAGTQNEPTMCNPNLVYCYDTPGCAGVGGGRTHGTGFARVSTIRRINPSVIRARDASGNSILCNSWRNQQDYDLGIARCLTLRSDAKDPTGMQELWRVRKTFNTRKL